MPPRLTRAALAKALGIHPGTVTRWERDGCPVAERAPRGRPSLFDLDAVRAWRRAADQAARAEGLSLEAERARLARAQATLAEKKLKALAGELLPAAEVRRVYSALVGATKAKLLAIPRAVAPELVQVAGAGGIPAIEAVLRRRVHEALTELARRPHPSETRRRR
jgi:phage terminase Nu1 subunit (DNA packaging protein)